MNMALVLGAIVLRMQKRAMGEEGTQFGGTTHLTSDLAGRSQSKPGGGLFLNSATSLNTNKAAPLLGSSKAAPWSLNMSPQLTAGNTGDSTWSKGKDSLSPKPAPAPVVTPTVPPVAPPTPSLAAPASTPHTQRQDERNRVNSPVSVSNHSMYGTGLRYNSDGTSNDTTKNPMLSIEGNVAPPKDLYRGANLRSAVDNTFQQQSGPQQHDVGVVPGDLGSKQRMFKTSAFVVGYRLAMGQI